MSTTEVRQPTAPAPFVLRALVWSVVIHLLCFGVWKVGRSQGWWQAQMPAWMLALEKKLLTPIEIKLPPPQKQQPTPLIFVDTDPALAEKEPPKNAKFYSANNTEAANTEIKKPSDVPNLTGSQTHVPKATDSEKSQAKPLQPTPKPQEQKQEQKEQKPQPEQKMGVGDLAMAKPNQGHALTNSEPVKEQQPIEKPRTIEEALARKGLKGLAMRQEGGVSGRKLVPSFAAQATSYGDYDAELADAVQTTWDRLLEDRTPTMTGHVVITFRLLPTGRVTEVNVIENTVDEFYAEVCKSAILDSAPFQPWPRQMQLDIGSDHRDVRFTFYYGNE